MFNKKSESVFCNAEEMIAKANREGYAIAHVNINNLEWAKAVLLTAQETKSPIIIGVSEGAAKYMGGLNVAHDMTAAMMTSLKITVPVAFHLDHGSMEGAIDSLQAGYSSVMFDGSHLSFDENFAKSEEIAKLAKKHKASFELEVGTIGGEEDGIIGNGDLADVEQCVKMASLKPTMLAAGIGNIHGEYPSGWAGLNFERLEKIYKATNNLAIVLHGGSGIPDDQIKKAISLGVRKINVNSELQWAFANATVEYVKQGKATGKGMDPRKLLAPGVEAAKKVIKDKLELFGSLGKA